MWLTIPRWAPMPPASVLVQLRTSMRFAAGLGWAGLVLKRQRGSGHSSRPSLATTTCQQAPTSVALNVLDVQPHNDNPYVEILFSDDAAKVIPDEHPPAGFCARLRVYVARGCSCNTTPETSICLLPSTLTTSRLDRTRQSVRRSCNASEFALARVNSTSPCII